MSAKIKYISHDNAKSNINRQPKMKAITIKPMSYISIINSQQELKNSQLNSNKINTFRQTGGPIATNKYRTSKNSPDRSIEARTSQDTRQSKPQVNTNIGYDNGNFTDRVSSQKYQSNPNRHIPSDEVDLNDEMELMRKKINKNKDRISVSSRTGKTTQYVNVSSSQKGKPFEEMRNRLQEDNNNLESKIISPRVERESDQDVNDRTNYYSHKQGNILINQKYISKKYNNMEVNDKKGNLPVRPSYNSNVTHKINNVNSFRNETLKPTFKKPIASSQLNNNKPYYGHILNSNQPITAIADDSGKNTPVSHMPHSQQPQLKPRFTSSTAQGSRKNSIDKNVKAYYYKNSIESNHLRDLKPFQHKAEIDIYSEQDQTRRSNKIINDDDTTRRVIETNRISNPKSSIAYNSKTPSGNQLNEYSVQIQGYLNNKSTQKTNSNSKAKLDQKTEEMRRKIDLQNKKLGIIINNRRPESQKGSVSNTSKNSPRGNKKINQGVVYINKNYNYNSERDISGNKSKHENKETLQNSIRDSSKSNLNNSNSQQNSKTKETKNVIKVRGSSGKAIGYKNIASQAKYNSNVSKPISTRKDDSTIYKKELPNKKIQNSESKKKIKKSENIEESMINLSTMSHKNNDLLENTDSGLNPNARDAIKLTAYIKAYFEKNKEYPNTIVKFYKYGRVSIF